MAVNTNCAAYSCACDSRFRFCSGCQCFKLPCTTADVGGRRVSLAVHRVYSIHIFPPTPPFGSHHVTAVYGPLSPLYNRSKLSPRSKSTRSLQDSHTTMSPFYQAYSLPHNPAASFVRHSLPLICFLLLHLPYFVAWQDYGIGYSI